MTNSDQNLIKFAIVKFEDALAILEHVDDFKKISEESQMLLDLIRALTYKLEK
jgi:hypothetical protein